MKSLTKNTMLTILDNDSELADFMIEKYADEYFAKLIKKGNTDTYVIGAYIHFLIKKYYTCKIYNFRIGRDSKLIHGKPLISIMEPYSDGRTWEIDMTDRYKVNGGSVISLRMLIIFHGDEFLKFKEFIKIINNKKFIFGKHGFYGRMHFEEFKKNIKLYMK